MIAGSLECSCESQVFYTWNEDMTAATNEKPAHPVQEDFDFLILLHIILQYLSFILKIHFWKMLLLLQF